MGESTSDYLVHAMAPALAVVLGFGAFAFSLVLQFRRGRYVASTYWLAVVMVGVFGTMAADVLHVGLGVPYPVSTALYASILAVVFIVWWRIEGTLSFHSIDTPRREAFYWAAVAATFAMGTAIGDLSAYTLNLGYFPSAIVSAAVIAVPAIGFRLFSWSAVFSFWFAYVVTRPLGASLADGFGKPKDLSGLGVGNARVALFIGLLILALVAWLARTRADVQHEPAQQQDLA